MRPRRNLFAYDSPFARDKPTIIVDNSEIILLYRKWRTQAKGTEGNCWKTFKLSYNRFTHQNLHCTRVKSENMQLKLNNRSFSLIAKLGAEIVHVSRMKYLKWGFTRDTKRRSLFNENHTEQFQCNVDSKIYFCSGINIGPLMIKSFTEFVGNQCKKWAWGK